MKHAEDIEGIYEFNQSEKFYSDRSRINIILSNLVSNSVKYHNMNQPNPYVKVSLDVNYKTLTIIVEDNGEGIPPQKIEKIFDMFYRASRNSNGSGLGLYIVKEIVNKLGGTIDVESEVNKGTKFIVKIPSSL